MKGSDVRAHCERFGLKICRSVIFNVFIFLQNENVARAMREKETGREKEYHGSDL